MDGFKIQLLGARKCHLSLPNRLIPISPKYRQAETSHNNVHQNKLNLFQDVYHNELARDQDPLVRRGQLEGSPQSLSRKRQQKASWRQLCQTYRPKRTQTRNWQQQTRHYWSKTDWTWKVFKIQRHWDCTVLYCKKCNWLLYLYLCRWFN